MNRLIPITLRDEDTNESFILQLSPKSALRAKNDLTFATNLLNIAQQQKNNESFETSGQGTSSYNPLNEETLDENLLTQEDSMENKENLKWSHEAIMLLIEEYRLRESLMSSGKISHKKAWAEIAEVMEIKGYKVSGRQCMTRINTMKRTYKTIKDHNSKSGNNKRTWKYFDVMESLLGEKPYMSPILTLSSTGFVSCSEEMKSPSSCSSSSVYQSDSEIPRKKRKIADIVEKFVENREIIEEGKNKRHKEKIEMQQKFLDKIDKLIEKM